MKQYLDVIIKDAEFEKEIVPEIIHISLKMSLFILEVLLDILLQNLDHMDLLL